MRIIRFKEFKFFLEIILFVYFKVKFFLNDLDDFFVFFYVFELGSECKKIFLI